MDGMDVDPPAPNQQQEGGSRPRSTSPLAFGSSSSNANPSSDPAGPQPQLQQLSQLRSSGLNTRECSVTHMPSDNTRLTRYTLKVLHLLWRSLPPLRDQLEAQPRVDNACSLREVLRQMLATLLDLSQTDNDIEATLLSSSPGKLYFSTEF